MSGRYDDIINLPHHVSAVREKMPMADRATQFAPFAALNGHESAISEVARYTETRPELTREQQFELSGRLSYAMALNTKPQISITYFEKDLNKPGGRLTTVNGIVKSLDQTIGVLTLTDGREITLDSICNIDGDIFD